MGRRAHPQINRYVASFISFISITNYLQQVIFHTPSPKPPNIGVVSCSVPISSTITPPPSKTSSSARFRGWLFVFQQHHSSTTPPPSKPSERARFRRWWLFYHHHHPTTLETERTCSFSKVVACLLPPPPYHLETEQMCSFSKVVACLLPPPPHHPRNRANVLVFEGDYLFTTTTTLETERVCSVSSG